MRRAPPFPLKERTVKRSLLYFLRRRGDRVTITTDKYATGPGPLSQKTVDYPNEWANGFHVMLDTEELVTVRWDQVVACPD